MEILNKVRDTTRGIQDLAAAGRTSQTSKILIVTGSSPGNLPIITRQHHGHMNSDVVSFDILPRLPDFLRGKPIVPWQAPASGRAALAAFCNISTLEFYTKLNCSFSIQANSSGNDIQAPSVSPSGLSIVRLPIT